MNSKNYVLGNIKNKNNNNNNNRTRNRLIYIKNHTNENTLHNLNILKNNLKKTVRFNNIINFITIPNREFLKNSNISNDLWWNPEDYIFFRNQSFIEQQVFCRNYPHIDKKKIEKILYQPSCG